MLRAGLICLARNAVVAIFLGWADAPVGFTLESVAPGEHVTVHYEWRGGSYRIVADLDITRVPDGLVIKRRNASASVVPGDMGELRLGPAELRNLDMMLGVYRQIRVGSCTTVERLRIRWPNAPVGHFTESLVYSTCRFYDRFDDLGPFFRSFASSPTPQGTAGESQTDTTGG